MSHNLNQFNNLFQTVLEEFLDGILVVTETREIIYANEHARALCAKITHGDQKAIAPEIWQVCQALLDSRVLFAHFPTTLEAEVTKLTDTVRIHVQWLEIASADHPCMLVHLQDKHAVTQGLAFTEAHEWGLTLRESEVWSLRRTGCARKQIAMQLFIVLDTVKKHLKNIQVKRQVALAETAWQAEHTNEGVCQSSQKGTGRNVRLLLQMFEPIGRED